MSEAELDAYFAAPHIAQPVQRACNSAGIADTCSAYLLVPLNTAAATTGIRWMYLSQPPGTKDAA